MKYEIDVNRLRRDLKDDYGTAVFTGFSMAAMDLFKVERLSDYEIVELALKKGVDLEKYII